MESKPTFYYIYDALCGWCFGMSPGIAQLKARYQDKINFTVLSGGMVTGSRIGPATDMAQYIRGAYKRVEEYAGVKFGPAYLDGTLSNPDAIFSSIKPAQALTYAKKVNPSIAVDFAHEIQNAIFQDGKLPDQWATYVAIATTFGFDATTFEQEARSTNIAAATEQEFALVKSWGVTGFPTIVMEHGGSYYLLSRGFTPVEGLEKGIEAVLATPVATS